MLTSFSSFMKEIGITICYLKNYFYFNGGNKKKEIIFKSSIVVNWNVQSRAKAHSFFFVCGFQRDRFELIACFANSGSMLSFRCRIAAYEPLI
jgi:hypothetical protein